MKTEDTDSPLDYKGFTGTSFIAFEDNVLCGRIKGIRHLVTYEAETPQELITEFKKSVDCYLEHCAIMRIEPK